MIVWWLGTDDGDGETRAVIVSKIGAAVKRAAEHKYEHANTNTQIQIHKYTNTAYYEVPERPNM